MVVTSCFHNIFQTTAGAASTHSIEFTAPCPTPRFYGSGISDGLRAHHFREKRAEPGPPLLAPSATNLCRGVNIGGCQRPCGSPAKWVRRAILKTLTADLCPSSELRLNSIQSRAGLHQSDALARPREDVLLWLWLLEGWASRIWAEMWKNCLSIYSFFPVNFIFPLIHILSCCC